LILHDRTHQLYFFLHVTHDYTRPITEGIRRASPGGMQSNFISDQFPLNARCLFNFHANVSNLPHIEVRFIMNR